MGGYSLKVKCWLVAPRDMGSTPVNPVPVKGRMAEWLKASVLKTEGCYHLAGSNPVPLFATVAQLGERPFCTWEVTGSSPVGCRIYLPCLQYVTEWLTCPLWEREIEGSSPSVLKNNCIS